MTSETEPRTLTCAECGIESDDRASGWRSILDGMEDDSDDPLEALLFCPECAAREFSSD